MSALRDAKGVIKAVSDGDVEGPVWLSAELTAAERERLHIMISKDFKNLKHKSSEHEGERRLQVWVKQSHQGYPSSVARESSLPSSVQSASGHAGFEQEPVAGTLTSTVPVLTNPMHGRVGSTKKRKATPIKAAPIDKQRKDILFVRAQDSLE